MEGQDSFSRHATYTCGTRREQIIDRIPGLYCYQLTGASRGAAAERRSDTGPRRPRDHASSLTFIGHPAQALAEVPDEHAAAFLEAGWFDERQARRAHQGPAGRQDQRCRGRRLGDSLGRSGPVWPYGRGMRVLIDLRADADGRPVGTICLDEQPPEEFADWLDLLRVLEACVNHLHEENSR
jgi:hypothetical protein